MNDILRLLEALSKNVSAVEKSQYTEFKEIVHLILITLTSSISLNLSCTQGLSQFDSKYDT